MQQYWTDNADEHRCIKRVDRHHERLQIAHLLYQPVFNAPVWMIPLEFCMAVYFFRKTRVVLATPP